MGKGREWGDFDPHSQTCLLQVTCFWVGIKRAEAVR